MLVSSGKNQFDNNVFSSREWSAPTLITAGEVRAFLRHLHLEGRKIKDILMIGYSYMHTRDWVEEYAYNHMPEELADAEKAARSDYDRLDSRFPFPRSIESDQPLLVRFEDGDTFEIDTPQVPEFRMSMNCIPWHIDTDCNYANCRASIVFSPCVGGTIRSVEVKSYSSDMSAVLSEYADEPGTVYERASDVILWLDNGFGLRVGPLDDYVLFECIDASEEIVSMPFWELKEALFNWKDIHEDHVLCFHGESAEVYVGKKGSDAVEEPYLSICQDNRKASLHISDDRFLLWNWSITNVLGTAFDECDWYRFSYEQWYAILREAEKLLMFSTFDELYDYLIGLEITTPQGKNLYQYPLNLCGVRFWSDREDFRKQWRDVAAWTELVLNDGEEIHLYGF